MTAGEVDLGAPDGDVRVSSGTHEGNLWGPSQVLDLGGGTVVDSRVSRSGNRRFVSLVLAGGEMVLERIHVRGHLIDTPEHKA